MKMNKEVVMVRLSDIIPNRFQPRLTFDEDALNELSNSIKEHGIIQPLILRDLGSKYEIIAGERRYKASTLAGLTEVPAIVGSMDDQTSAELALIENIQRKDLSAIEEAKSYKKILEMGGFTQEQLAKRMGKSQSTIANKMRLLSLTNEVQLALMNNLISERHARCLLQIKDEEKQKEVLNKITTERMNVRDTDDYIKNMLGITKSEPPKEEPIPVALNTEVAPENIPNMFSEDSVTAINPPHVEVPKEPEIVTEEKKENANPNVYKEENNNDFIDINALTEEPQMKNEGINVPEISVPEVTIPEVNEEIVTEPIKKEIDPMEKLKYATAIKMAKDTLENIKSAGYNALLEEVDNGSEYQIIIKIEK